MIHSFSDKDQYWMKHAIKLADKAQVQGEVPVGAVIVSDDNQILGEGYNQSVTEHDATAHAEVRAIKAAGASNQNYRLSGSTLYVTLEPCMMCVGAIIHARIKRLVYGAPDLKSGAVHSQDSLLDVRYVNHKVQVDFGLFGDDITLKLKGFFKSRR